MTEELEGKLIETLEEEISQDDPSHDLQHVLRVLENAKNLARSEYADLDVVIPAALFHDLINYPKNDPRNKNSVVESAERTRDILKSLNGYPEEKINLVEQAIKCTSFSFGQKPVSPEDKVVRDADMLEATGAIAIMRTFASSGKMRRSFYCLHDPFAEKRTPDDMRYSIDLFYTRLLKITNELSTQTAKRVAKRRSEFLKSFLSELKLEIQGR